MTRRSPRRGTALAIGIAGALALGTRTLAAEAGAGGAGGTGARGALPSTGAPTVVGAALMAMLLGLGGLAMARRRAV